MYEIVIVRDLFFDGKASLGTTLIYDPRGNQIFKSESLERGWVNNQNRVSCVPTGVYDCFYEYSNRFRKKLWELKGVPGRSECKFHAANYWHQLNGCIALGQKRKFLDQDAIADVTSSRLTMKAFEDCLEGQHRVRVHVIDILKQIRP